MTAPLDVFHAAEIAGESSDVVRTEDLLALADAEGPCATLVVPTHPHGRESVQGAQRLSQMTKRLTERLGAGGFDDRSIHKFVAPLRALVGDGDFWQHQSRSLVLFRTARWTWKWRLDHELAEEMSLAASPRIRVLLPALGASSYHVLAISQNQVRVLTVVGNDVQRRELPGLPDSVGDALRFESYDKNLGFHTTGSQLHRHGTGIGGEVEKDKVRRYLQVLDRALAETCKNWQSPMVLACTDECAAMFKGLSKMPSLVAEHVAGSPDRITDTELARLAAPIAARVARSRVVDGRDAALFREMDGTGRVVRGITDTVTALGAASVEVLFVDDGGPVWGNLTAGLVVESGRAEPGVLDEDLVGRCVADGLRQGARVHLVRVGALGDQVPVAALTRF